MEEFEDQEITVEKGEIIPIITDHQLAKLVGRKYNQVVEASKKILKGLGETQLDCIYPLGHEEGNSFSGPRFVIRNDKYYDYVEKCKNKPIKK